jgi:hypothetical protein
MVEAERTSEMSIYFNETTLRYIPEWYLHTHRRRNLKYQVNILMTHASLRLKQIMDRACKGDVTS